MVQIYIKYLNIDRGFNINRARIAVSIATAYRLDDQGSGVRF
jgi:hypothetical protein